MKGCRPLTDIEIESVMTKLETTRDKTLFQVGLNCGFRISEILSLKISDVIRNGKIMDSVSVERKYMKRKQEGRTVLLNQKAKNALQALVIEMGNASSDSFLFKSAKGFNKPLTRIGAWCALKKGFDAAKLDGKVATHSMRKTFAAKIYEKLNGDLLGVQKALAQKNYNSTLAYLSFKQDKVDDAIMSL
jgi:integrase